MILLYGASTVYHTLNISENINRILRKVDHMMIFILISMALIAKYDKNGEGNAF